MTIDFEKDAGAQAAPADALARVTMLGEQLIEQQAAVARATQALQEQKDLLRALEEVELPELMKEVGMTFFGLADGSKIEVKKQVSTAITEARRTEAHAWLVENGFGGLIKTIVSKEFGKGELELATAFAIENEAAMKESVHPGTLKSFVVEQLEAGAAIPFDLFSIHPYDKAVVTPPKKPKAKKAAAK